MPGRLLVWFDFAIATSGPGPGPGAVTATVKDPFLSQSLPVKAAYSSSQSRLSRRLSLSRYGQCCHDLCPQPCSHGYHGLCPISVTAVTDSVP